MLGAETEQDGELGQQRLNVKSAAALDQLELFTSQISDHDIPSPVIWGWHPLPYSGLRLNKTGIEINLHSLDDDQVQDLLVVSNCTNDPFVWDIPANEVEWQNPLWVQEVNQLAAASSLRLQPRRFPVLTTQPTLDRIVILGPSGKPHSLQQIQTYEREGQWGTLLLEFGTHSGGLVDATHPSGYSYEHPTAQEEKPLDTHSNYSYVAMFQNVSAKINPINTGYKVVLMYALIQVESGSLPMFTFNPLRTFGTFETLVDNCLKQLKNPWLLFSLCDGRRLECFATGLDCTLKSVSDEDARLIRFLVEAGTRYEVLVGCIEMPSSPTPHLSSKLKRERSRKRKLGVPEKETEFSFRTAKFGVLHLNLLDTMLVRHDDAPELTEDTYHRGAVLVIRKDSVQKLIARTPLTTLICHCSRLPLLAPETISLFNIVLERLPDDHESLSAARLHKMTNFWNKLVHLHPHDRELSRSLAKALLARGLYPVDKHLNISNLPISFAEHVTILKSSLDSVCESPGGLRIFTVYLAHLLKLSLCNNTIIRSELASLVLLLADFISNFGGSLSVLVKPHNVWGIFLEAVHEFCNDSSDLAVELCGSMINTTKSLAIQKDVNFEASHEFALLGRFCAHSGFLRLLSPLSDLMAAISPRFSCITLEAILKEVIEANPSWFKQDETTEALRALGGLIQKRLEEIPSLKISSRSLCALLYFGSFDPLCYTLDAIVETVLHKYSTVTSSQVEALMELRNVCPFYYRCAPLRKFVFTITQRVHEVVINQANYIPDWSLRSRTSNDNDPLNSFLNSSSQRMTVKPFSSHREAYAWSESLGSHLCVRKRVYEKTAENGTTEFSLLLTKRLPRNHSHSQHTTMLQQLEETLSWMERACSEEDLNFYNFQLQ